MKVHFFVQLYNYRAIVTTSDHVTTFNRKSASHNLPIMKMKHNL